MVNEKEIEELKNRLREIFSDYYEIAGGKNYRYHHLVNVHKLVKNLADKIDEDFDREILEIAALYHDIGRSEDIENGEMDPHEGHEGHAEKGAEKVSEFVSDYVTEEELERIEDVIRNHHSEAQSLEGKLVQDADKISNFGVSNLWRQIHYASQHNLEFEESVDYFWETGVEEYENQINRMHFKGSKQVAQERLEKQKKAIKRMEKEINGEDV